MRPLLLLCLVGSSVAIVQYVRLDTSGLQLSSLPPMLVGNCSKRCELTTGCAGFIVNSTLGCEPTSSPYQSNTLISFGRTSSPVASCPYGTKHFASVTYLRPITSSVPIGSEQDNSTQSTPSNSSIGVLPNTTETRVSASAALASQTPSTIQSSRTRTSTEIFTSKTASTEAHLATPTMRSSTSSTSASSAAGLRSATGTATSSAASSTRTVGSSAEWSLSATTEWLPREGSKTEEVSYFSTASSANRDTDPDTSPSRQSSATLSSPSLAPSTESQKTTLEQIIGATKENVTVEGVKDDVSTSGTAGSSSTTSKVDEPMQQPSAESPVVESQSLPTKSDHVDSSPPSGSTSSMVTPSSSSAHLSTGGAAVSTVTAMASEGVSSTTTASKEQSTMIASTLSTPVYESTAAVRQETVLLSTVASTSSGASTLTSSAAASSEMPTSSTSPSTVTSKATTGEFSSSTIRSDSTLQLTEPSDPFTKNVSGEKTSHGTTTVVAESETSTITDVSTSLSTSVTGVAETTIRTVYAGVFFVSQPKYGAQNDVKTGVMTQEKEDWAVAQAIYFSITPNCEWVIVQRNDLVEIVLKGGTDGNGGFQSVKGIIRVTGRC